MIKLENHLGEITITNNYLMSLIGHAVTGCFGVVRMNPIGAKQGVRTNILGSTSIDNGVKIHVPKGTNSMIIDRIKKTIKISVSTEITVGPI